MVDVVGLLQKSISKRAKKIDDLAGNDFTVYAKKL